MVVGVNDHLVWYGIVWFWIILGTFLATFVFISMLKSYVLIRFGMVWFGWYGMLCFWVFLGTCLGMTCLD